MTMAPTAPSTTHTMVPILATVPIDHPGLARRIRNWNDAEQIHQAVMSLFRENLPGPEQRRRATAEILYRVDQNAGRILVQAAVAPIRADYGIRATDLSGLIARLVPDMAIQFRLDINAVHCQSRTHRRTPVPDVDLPDWLAQRLHPALAAVSVLDAPVTVRRAGQTPLRIAHVTGTARIADQNALLHMIRSGVGRAKAYGCGLLSVLPTSK